MTADSSFTFACPRCHTHLEQVSPDELLCSRDDLTFKKVDQVWRMLLPERETIYHRFIQEYETIRRAEGRGSPSPAYYRALPHRDLNQAMSRDWRIRATSFTALLKQVLSPSERRTGRALRILDLGAGNGWLSNQLAGRGHTLAAVDLVTNDFDGLGCFRHYSTSFCPVQAEFDHLPFSDSAADLVIFNASLHYSTAYPATLGEARRVVGPSGKILVMDSPVYHTAASGARMVRERESHFTQRFGFPSNALPSENYLTYTRLHELAASLKLNMRLITPFYSLDWLLRPLMAHLSGAREPAKFHLILFSPVD